jgi:glutaredoxin
MFCKKVKEYLSQKDIAFTERDISKDDEAMKELQKMGVMTTPVTTIDGEIVIGFDQKKLEQLLGN